MTAELTAELIACEHSQVVGDEPAAVMNGVAAPTRSITQEAASTLSRRAHLVFGRRCRDLICPGDWLWSLGASLFMAVLLGTDLCAGSTTTHEQIT